MKNFDVMSDNDLTQLKNDIREILNCLKGSDMMKDNGLICRVDKAEKKLKLHDYYFALAFGGGAVIIFIIKIIA
jgi:hypothetical protein